MIYVNFFLPEIHKGRCNEIKSWNTEKICFTLSRHSEKKCIFELNLNINYDNIVSEHEVQSYCQHGGNIMWIRFLFIFLIVLMAPSLSLAQMNDDYDRALYYYKKANYAEAVKYLNLYLEKKPDPSAYYLKGYALYKIGSYGDASKNFEDAYFIDPMFDPEKIDFGESSDMKKH